MLQTDFTPFANRLLKMSRHYDKWARRQGLRCYRIYDGDIPEFPFAIDRYEEHVHLAEYHRQKTDDPEEHRQWVRLLRMAISETLGVPMPNIHLKVRAPQKGKQQYDKQAEIGKAMPVTENGLQFWVNLDDYLDTGLFLDHRNLRQRVREEAAGKRVLNLFAYTGAFTVYAAAGGAVSTLTIDMSNTYLAWAERNLELNQLNGPQHRLLRADVTAWLREAPREQFDIIVLDPPTFSNSKNMRGVLDTQADHPFLINACVKRLAKGGVLYFSTNYRRFKLEEDVLHLSVIKEISGQTVPQDFRKPIHRAWEMRP